MNEAAKTFFARESEIPWFSWEDPKEHVVIKMKTLYSNSESGVSVVYTDCPSGYHKTLHHHEYAQAFYVIEGSLEADGQILKKGDYVCFPANTPGTHGTTDVEGSLYLQINFGKNTVIYDL